MNEELKEVLELDSSFETRIQGMITELMERGEYSEDECKHALGSLVYKNYRGNTPEVIAEGIIKGYNIVEQLNDLADELAYNMTEDYYGLRDYNEIKTIVRLKIKEYIIQDY